MVVSEVRLILGQANQENVNVAPYPLIDTSAESFSETSAHLVRVAELILFLTRRMFRF
jgi:hypothetical protein